MKLQHPFWQNSKCINSYLHRLKITQEWGEQVLETCEICHKSVFFKVIDGKLQKDHYLSYHLREALGNLPIPNYIYHEREFDPLSNKVTSPYANRTKGFRK